MKKLIISLGLVGSLALSTLSQAGNLSASEKEFIFGEKNVKAEAVSSEEMKKTEGKWLHFSGSHYSKHLYKQSYKSYYHSYKHPHTYKHNPYHHSFKTKSYRYR